MPTFNYTSGNTANLTGGGPASMTDIQGPFTDLRSAVNGNLDETNVPNLTAAFTTYKQLFAAFAGQSSAGAAGTYLMQLGPPTATDIALNTSAAAPWAVLLSLDPTGYNANARTTKLRIRAACISNHAAAPAVNFVVGLYPVTGVATPGGSGTHVRVATVGTVVSGSTAAINAPSAGIFTTATSTDFNFPAAGAYVLGIAQSGTPAAGNVTDLTAVLEMRQV